MLHPSTQKLIDKLAEMTALKQIDWAEAREGGVIYATEGYAVKLSESPPRVTLTTEKGRILEEASASVLKETPHEDRGTYSDLIVSVVKEASRIAKGTEAAIDALLAGLSGHATNASKPGAAQPPAESETSDPPQSREAATPTPDEETPPVDASVPETAIIEDDIMPEGEITGFDEEDVGGAVARLADEVNGRGSSAGSAYRNLSQGDEVTAFSAASETTSSPDEKPDVWDRAGPDAGPADTRSENRKPARPYIPFGLGSAQVIGAEISDETAAEEDTESELGAASTGMRLGATARSTTRYDYSEDDTAPGTPPPSFPLSLRGFRARIEEEFAVSDETGHAFKAAPVSSSAEEDDTDQPDEVSPADLDAVSPPDEEAGSQSADEDLFAEGDAPAPERKREKRSGKDSKPEKPVRRKSRFNPWS